MNQYETVNYGLLAKAGFLIGVLLFVIGAAGEIIGHMVFTTLPAWEETLLFDLEVIGLIVGFFSPIVFGIFLPLLE